MDLTIIWICDSEKKNQKNTNTLSALSRECASVDGSVSLYLYGAAKKLEEEVRETFPAEGKVSLFVPALPEGAAVVDENGIRAIVRPDLIYADCAKQIKGRSGLVTMVYSGDVFSKGAFGCIARLSAAYPEQTIFMLQKKMPNPILEEREESAFALGPVSGMREGIVDLSAAVACHPFYLGGTFLKTEVFTPEAFALSAGPDTERAFFLQLCMEKGAFVFTKEAVYQAAFPYEGDMVYFRRLYREEYYIDALRDFWLLFLAKLKKEKGAIPDFIQYHLCFSLRCRFRGNYDNKNKHVIEGREEEFLALVKEILDYLEDRILLCETEIEEARPGFDLGWVFGIYKHGSDYRYHLIEKDGKVYFGDAGVCASEWETLFVKIKLMDDQNGTLSIDGDVDPLLYSIADEVYLQYKDRKIPLTYNGRYALKKFFGLSFYKSEPFHAVVEDLDPKGGFLGFFARVGEKVLPVRVSLTAHFSRMGPLFRCNYWVFYADRKYLMTKKDAGFYVRAAARPRICLQEFLLLNEMLFCRDLRAKLFILIRLAFFAARPFIKRRPVWMYLDKIYKGGDSAEYLYKYCVAQKDKNKHYYLIDKDTPDYKRLVAEGYKPLVRGSILHRLVFLMADMMVISNSTVFAFNNFGTINSSYIRDLPAFHVCCVQHGMSVQKIALAQNRLRDNTRLYFCASKYEIENLSRPVYDYVGYDALRLTGVPRYDGLVNDDKKQIMISPTWRMQSAVPVKGSEGYQRGYNPMFKESPYFKVYNGLCSNPRLIEAAKKYGYKIKYVLHPIVSAQAKDFTKNEDVEIIPAVGDMSYEKLFCESSLMVTDFSGVQFDFAYMKKPVLYLHHKDIPQHYEEGSFFYDTMAFGEIAYDNETLIDLLIDYMKNGCKMKEQFKARVDDFFHFHDRNNCERIYAEMTAYQEKYILHKGKRA